MIWMERFKLVNYLNYEYIATTGTLHETCFNFGPRIFFIITFNSNENIARKEENFVFVCFVLFHSFVPLLGHR